MKGLRDFFIFLVLTGLLLGVSAGAKTYLSSSQSSIVKEFINIPFAIRMAKLLFMNHSIAASQYYQFLASVYATRLNYPHYHLRTPGHDHEHEHEHSHKHEHGGDHNAEGVEIVGYTHGPGETEIPLTQKELDAFREKERMISAQTSLFIDIDYFYDLLDLASALDPENLYPLTFGRGWILNANMAEKMIQVLSNANDRSPQWRTLFDAGWIALYNLRDYEKARGYLQRSSRMKGAPDFVANIYAFSFYVDKKYEAAIAQIYQQIKETDDHNLRTRLESRLNWYKDLLTLNRAAKAYREKTGKDISSVQDLVSSGLVREIPADTMGKGFAWDEKNREVISQDIYDVVKK